MSEDSAGWSRAERVQVQAVESRLQHINAAVALSLDAKDRDLDIDEPYFMYSYKTILRSGAAGRSCRLFYGAQTPEAVPLDLMPEYELEIVVSHTLAFRFYDGWSGSLVRIRSL
ncbi:hypothetical protein EV182_002186 [Spiromyces aspiralis]|uniref:Uncharacterized protein n=1 Tax=Spiromyces aspiralis TaxID=68401 RepID=A0ACC1HSE6_9FUNG|nr:hypothetical protein EV182_002186 [Spiromyces aspiralis]